MPISQKTDPNQWPDRFLVMLSDAMHRGETEGDYNILPITKEGLRAGGGEDSIYSMLHIGILELMPVEGEEPRLKDGMKAVITELAKSLMNGEFRGIDPTLDIPHTLHDSVPASGNAARAQRSGSPKAERPAKDPDAPSKPRKGSMAGKKLTALVAENPRAEGSFGFKSMKIILDNPGILYEAYIEAGGRQKDLGWDIDHGWTKVED